MFTNKEQGKRMDERTVHIQTHGETPWDSDAQSGTDPDMVDKAATLFAQLFLQQCLEERKRRKHEKLL